MDNNIKDQAHYAPTVQVGGQQSQNNEITIDGLTGNTNQQPEQENGNTFRISSNIKKRRPVNSQQQNTNRQPSSNRVEVNPNEILPKQKKASIPQQQHMKNTAINQLEAAVARKKQEYKDFVHDALIADEENRARVEAGLEEVQGEIQYLPDNVDKARTTEIEDDGLDDVERDLENDLKDLYKGPETIDTRNVRIENDPFGASNIHADEEEIVDEQVESEDEYYDDETEETYDTISEESEEVENDYDYTDEEESYDEEPEQIEDQEEDTPVDIDVQEEEKVVEDTTETDEPEVENTTDNLQDSKEEKQKEEDKEPNIDEIITKDITAGSIVVKSNIDVGPNSDIKSASASDFDINSEDLDGADDEDNPDSEDAEIAEITRKSEDMLKAEILEKIIKQGRKLDTTSFAVSNKVIPIRDALRHSRYDKKVERTGSWPLMFAGRMYTATALRGPEVTTLSDYDDADHEGGMLLTVPQAKIMYEHDANPYKPPTLEAWAKTIPIADADNMFAALYIASLRGANYFPVVCPQPKCQFAKLTDDVDINTMIRFKSDKVKERFEKIKATPVTAELTTSYESVINVINDQYAVSIKLPSIYNMLFEYWTLDTNFMTKYAAVVTILTYVDYIYYINPVTKQYEPIGWKVYPGDATKTFKSKISTYSKIIREFEDYDFDILIALINAMSAKAQEERNIQFFIPASKCDKCGADIPEREILPRQLVFMRQRLVRRATTQQER